VNVAETKFVAIAVPNDFADDCDSSGGYAENDNTVGGGTTDTERDGTDDVFLGGSERSIHGRTDVDNAL
jgi:hypothetical protein